MVKAKNLFLVFPEVDASMSLQDVYAQLNAKPSLRFNQYIISRGKDKQDIMYFTILLLAEPLIQIRGTSKIKLVFNGKSYYANWASIKHYTEILEYACRAGEEYITNLPNTKNKRLLKLQPLLLRMRREKASAEMINYFAQNYLDKAFPLKSGLNETRRLQLMDTMDNRLRDQEYALWPFELENFKVSPAMKNWIDSKRVITAILVGPAGYGKNAFAVALANEYRNMLTVHHMESLSQLSEKHDMIFFDNPDLDGLEDKQLRALLQIQDKSQPPTLSPVIANKSKIVHLIALSTSSLQKLGKKIGKEQLLCNSTILPVSSELIATFPKGFERDEQTYCNQEIIARNQKFYDKAEEGEEDWEYESTL